MSLVQSYPYQPAPRSESIQYISLTTPPSNLPPPSRRLKVARNQADLTLLFINQARNRARSRSLLSQSRRNSMVLACLKAERTSFTISAAVQAATTAQIRLNPVPKIPITCPCRQAIENTGI